MELNTKLVNKCEETLWVEVPEDIEEDQLAALWENWPVEYDDPDCPDCGGFTMGQSELQEAAVSPWVNTEVRALLEHVIAFHEPAQKYYFHY